MKHLKLLPQSRRILLLVGVWLWLLPHWGNCQSPHPLVTIDARQMPLKTFIKQLAEQTHYRFFYREEWLTDKLVTFECANIELPLVLERTMKHINLEFRIVHGNMVAIMPENEVRLAMMQLDRNFASGELAGAVMVGNPREAGRKPLAHLSGKVIDSNSGESVVGATIQIENTTFATVTNATGDYSFDIKPGNYWLAVSSVAFEKSRFAIKLVADGSYNLELFEQTHNLNEVSIYADRTDKNVSRNQMSLIELDSKGIKFLTAIAGEKDIIKSMTRMPGVQSVGEFGSGINVRGGGEDQNLYMIDEAPLFNTAHVFGILSVLNPDAVKSATLYKGHIPAEFGERVSSVMDIGLSHNQLQKTNVIGGIGLYSSRLMVKSPLVKDKLSLQIGGRSSYSDWLLKRLPDYNLRHSTANFYDANATLSGDFKKDKLSLTLYYSHDQFSYNNQFAYKYGNALGSFIWTHIYTPNFTGRTTLAYSSYISDKDETELVYEQSRTRSDIGYAKAKMDFTYTGFRQHTLRFGLQAMHYSILPGKYSPLNDSSLVQPYTLAKEQGAEAALYVSDNYELSSKISVNAGLRFTGFANLGPKTEYVYLPDAPKTDATSISSLTYKNNEVVMGKINIEPRLSIKYQLTDYSALKMSYNRNQQNIFLISSTSVATPDNTWKLADNHFKPIMANQFALGYYHNIYNNVYELSAETYYKVLENLPEYKNDAQIELNPHLETEMVAAQGTNYGIELMARKSAGQLTGSVGYTYSRSMRQTDSPYATDQINRNEVYPSNYDKPHDLNIEATYSVNRRLRYSANFSLTSGRAVTLPEYKYVAGRETVVVYSDRNKYRLPLYHRLDLSVSLDESLRRKKKWKGSWTFSVMNVYARKNAYSVFYSKSQPGELSSYEIYTLKKLYFIGQPLPTLTYNFIF